MSISQNYLRMSRPPRIIRIPAVQRSFFFEPADCPSCEQVMPIRNKPTETKPKRTAKQQKNRATTKIFGRFGKSLYWTHFQQHQHPKASYHNDRKSQDQCRLLHIASTDQLWSSGSLKLDPKHRNVPSHR